jgi:protein-tyrosine phosphatase
MRGIAAREALSESLEVESAGTGDWHVGSPADPRSAEAARRRGLLLEGRARQFTRADWGRFDHVLAMDRANYDDLARTAPPGVAEAKLRLLRSFDPASPEGASVPDPYYAEAGFDEVIDLCIAACEGLVAYLREQHELGR